MRRRVTLRAAMALSAVCGLGPACSGPSETQVKASLREAVDRAMAEGFTLSAVVREVGDDEGPPWQVEQMFRPPRHFRIVIEGSDIEGSDSELLDEAFIGPRRYVRVDGNAFYCVGGGRDDDAQRRARLVFSGLLDAERVRAVGRTIRAEHRDGKSETRATVTLHRGRLATIEMTQTAGDQTRSWRGSVEPPGAAFDAPVDLRPPPPGSEPCPGTEVPAGPAPVS